LTANDGCPSDLGGSEHLDPQAKGDEVIAEPSAKLTVEQEIRYDKLEWQTEDIPKECPSLQIDKDRCI
jgi:hypothetical protein